MIDDFLQPMLPAKRPVGRPPKTGLYSKFTLVPLTEIKKKEIMEIISGQRLMLAPTDYIMVDLLARSLAQLDLISRHINEHGCFQDDASGKSRGAVSPYIQMFWAGVGRVSKLCEQLGLTPQSRVNLGRNVAQTDDLATRIQKAKEA